MRGGKRPGAGRRKVERPANVTDKNAAARLIDALHSLPTKDEPIEIAGWRGLWDSTITAIRLDTRKYLYDKRDGKAVHTVNHLHDKPIELHHTLSLGEGMKLAMKKAEERVRARG